jgi:tetraprenyl-beta-curcumene synthase
MNAFWGAATRYWLGIFPQVAYEVRHWRRQAQRIPDPVLRGHALDTQRSERGNLEGAAAFAVLVPRSHRTKVVRASLAFQIAYDYLDTLAEQPCRDPVANSRRLHLALLSALDATATQPDYHELISCGSHDDDGYVESLVMACREALAELPSYPVVEAAAIRAVRRMVAYQSLNHNPCGETQALARWASSLTPPGTGLRWWETAAGAASSLTLFPLIAAAARPMLDVDEMAATERAYFPWIGALNLLLDSFIDQVADFESGHHSLVDHYDSLEQAAERLGVIAARAMQATESVPESTQHALILAAMTSFYLSAPAAATPEAGIVSQHVLAAMDSLAAPAMMVLRARRRAGRVIQGAFSHV